MKINLPGTEKSCCYSTAKIDADVLEELESGFLRLRRSDAATLLKKYLSKRVFTLLQFKITPLGATLSDAIRIGLKHHDHVTGVVLPDKYAYDVFSVLFDPLLEERHFGFERNETHPAVEWGDWKKIISLDPNRQFIQWLSISASRNLDGYRFTPTMNMDELKNVEDRIMMTLYRLSGEYKGVYEYIQCMHPHRKEELEDDFCMFDCGDKYDHTANISRFWSYGRGVYLNEDHTFVVKVNEKDHVCITSQEWSGDLQAVYRRLVTVMPYLDLCLKPVRHPHLGFLTVDPDLLGCGLTISAQVKMRGMSPDLLEKVSKVYHLDISELHENVYMVKTRSKLGFNEFDVIKKYNYGLLELVHLAIFVSQKLKEDEKYRSASLEGEMEYLYPSKRLKESENTMDMRGTQIDGEDEAKPLSRKLSIQIKGSTREADAQRRVPEVHEGVPTGMLQRDTSQTPKTEPLQLKKKEDEKPVERKEETEKIKPKELVVKETPSKERKDVDMQGTQIGAKDEAKPVPRKIYIEIKGSTREGGEEGSLTEVHEGVPTEMLQRDAEDGKGKADEKSIELKEVREKIKPRDFHLFEKRPRDDRAGIGAEGTKKRKGAKPVSDPGMVAAWEFPRKRNRSKSQYDRQRNVLKEKKRETRKVQESEAEGGKKKHDKKFETIGLGVPSRMKRRDSKIYSPWDRKQRESRLLEEKKRSQRRRETHKRDAVRYERSTYDEKRHRHHDRRVREARRKEEREREHHKKRKEERRREHEARKRAESRREDERRRAEGSDETLEEEREKLRNVLGLGLAAGDQPTAEERRAKKMAQKKEREKKLEELKKVLNLGVSAGVEPTEPDKKIRLHDRKAREAKDKEIRHEEEREKRAIAEERKKEKQRRDEKEAESDKFDQDRRKTRNVIYLGAAVDEPSAGGDERRIRNQMLVNRENAYKKSLERKESVEKNKEQERAKLKKLLALGVSAGTEPPPLDEKTRRYHDQKAKEAIKRKERERMEREKQRQAILKNIKAERRAEKEAAKRKREEERKKLKNILDLGLSAGEQPTQQEREERKGAEKKQREETRAKMKKALDLGVSAGAEPPEYDERTRRSHDRRAREAIHRERRKREERERERERKIREKEREKERKIREREDRRRAEKEAEKREREEEHRKLKNVLNLGVSAGVEPPEVDERTRECYDRKARESYERKEREREKCRRRKLEEQREEERREVEKEAKRPKREEDLKRFEDVLHLGVSAREQPTAEEREERKRAEKEEKERGHAKLMKALQLGLSAGAEPPELDEKTRKDNERRVRSALKREARRKEAREHRRRHREACRRAEKEAEQHKQLEKRKEFNILHPGISSELDAPDVDVETRMSHVRRVRGSSTHAERERESRLKRWENEARKSEEKDAAAFEREQRQVKLKKRLALGGTTNAEPSGNVSRLRLSPGAVTPEVVEEIRSSRDQRSQASLTTVTDIEECKEHCNLELHEFHRSSVIFVPLSGLAQSAYLLTKDSLEDVEVREVCGVSNKRVSEQESDEGHSEGKRLLDIGLVVAVESSGGDSESRVQNCSLFVRQAREYEENDREEREEENRKATEEKEREVSKRRNDLDLEAFSGTHVMIEKTRKSNNRMTREASDMATKAREVRKERNERGKSIVEENKIIKNSSLEPRRAFMTATRTKQRREQSGVKKLRKLVGSGISIGLERASGDCVNSNRCGRPKNAELEHRKKVNEGAKVVRRSAKREAPKQIMQRLSPKFKTKFSLGVPPVHLGSNCAHGNFRSKSSKTAEERKLASIELYHRSSSGKGLWRQRQSLARDSNRKMSFLDLKKGAGEVSMWKKSSNQGMIDVEATREKFTKGGVIRIKSALKNRSGIVRRAIL